MIAGFVYMFAKRREMLAFTAQQVIPVAQDEIQTVASTIGKAGASIAKEISKGIKEGINNNDEEK